MSLHTMSADEIWEKAACGRGIMLGGDFIDALRKQGFSEGAIDGVFEMVERLPFILQTEDLDFVDLRRVVVAKGVEISADMDLSLIERSAALVERVLAAQGDGAEADLVILQHELTAAVIKRRKFLTQ